MSDTDEPLPESTPAPVEEPEEPVEPEEPAPVEEPVEPEEPEEPAPVEEPEEPAPVEEPDPTPVETAPVSTQEVVQNVQEILTTEPAVSSDSASLEERVKVLEERLERLIDFIRNSPLRTHLVKSCISLL